MHAEMAEVVRKTRLQVFPDCRIEVTAWVFRHLHSDMRNTGGSSV
jgi:hypothetical protein